MPRGCHLYRRCPGSDAPQGFDNILISSDYLAWTVSAAAGGTYQVTALVNTTAGEQFTVAVQGTSSSITFTAPAGWNRITVGNLTLPTGTSTIVLSRNTLTHDVSVKSMELLRVSDIPAYNARVSAARASTAPTSRPSTRSPPNRAARQTLYSQTWSTAGTHTIKAVKTSGNFMLLDAFLVWP